MVNLLSLHYLKSSPITLYLEFLGAPLFHFFDPIILINFLSSWSLVFQGYSDDHLGYLCFDRIANKIYVRHCKFIEDMFYFATTSSTESDIQGQIDISSWASTPQNKEKMESTSNGMPSHCGPPNPCSTSCANYPFTKKLGKS